MRCAAAASRRGRMLPWVQGPGRAAWPKAESRSVAGSALRSLPPLGLCLLPPSPSPSLHGRSRVDLAGACCPPSRVASCVAGEAEQHGPEGLWMDISFQDEEAGGWMGLQLL